MTTPSDERLAELVAEKVLGWERHPHFGPKPLPDLTDWRTVGLILEKIRTKADDVTFDRFDAELHRIVILRRDPTVSSVDGYGSTIGDAMDLEPRDYALAALAALAVDVED